MKLTNNKKIALLLSSLSSINFFPYKIMANEENIETYSYLYEDNSDAQINLEIALFLKDANILKSRISTEGQDTVGKCTE